MAKPNSPLSPARTLRDDFYKVTAGQAMRWLMVDELWLGHPNTLQATLDTAITLQIAEGWITGEGTRRTRSA